MKITTKAQDKNRERLWNRQGGYCVDCRSPLDLDEAVLSGTAIIHASCLGKRLGFDSEAEQTKIVGPAELSLMKALHKQGMPYRGIADVLGRGKNTVERCLSPTARERDRVRPVQRSLSAGTAGGVDGTDYPNRMPTGSELAIMDGTVVSLVDSPAELTVCPRCGESFQP